jgi:hypothetical protein
MPDPASETFEAQTCPDRMGMPGPWDRAEGRDRWDHGRWSADPEAVRARHDAEDAPRLAEHNARNEARGEAPITLEEYRAKWYVRGPHNDLWLWSWGPPRVCSFCGGIHPEDAIRLVSEGWEIDPTGKSYKRYLNPPGSAQRHAAFLASCRDPNREPGEGVPSVWAPTPPVKLYAWHLDADQRRRFNEAVDAHPTGG